MEIYLAEQTAYFLEAILLGAVFGLVYDIFRIMRLAVPTAKGVIFAEDILFFGVCAVATFLFLMRSIDGELRFFILIGEALGLLLYFFTLSPLIMGVSEAVINAVKTVLRWIFRRILLPVWELLLRICTQLLRPVRYFGGKLVRFFKKSAQICKKRLKMKAKLLYNQLKSKGGRKRPLKYKKKKRQGRGKRAGASGKKAKKTTEKS